jgi:hypothetical protein
MAHTYKVQRLSLHGAGSDGHLRTRTTTVRTGLSLEEAQAHCQDPETAGQTATGAAARRISKRLGTSDWRDQYTEA